ncbi:MAG: phosphoribosylglycinamide formyltransferase [Candidatus Aminicenantes bacterium]|nr:phosphoribosylglycinamide formyltransferase [Candidatus Aminicenantes bacterium]MDH5384969.1 phosphoribosylglycinamide formyltransferase [Candidatus Aminicenantes bacterium]
MSEEVFKSPKKKGRIAVFLSGRGSNFKAIHDAILAEKINGEIVLVFSNKREALGLKIAQEQNLETLYLNPKEFDSREAYDQAILDEVKKRDVDLICLAGYMKILTSLFCNELKNRIMNIHPALLPSFPGLHVQQKAIDWGVRYSGATVHLVTADVDMGPIILQAVVPVLQNDTEDTLSERILKEEHKIYPEAVKLFFEGRLEIRGRQVFIR